MPDSWPNGGLGSTPVTCSNRTQMPRAVGLSHAVKKSTYVIFMDMLRLSSPSSVGRPFCPCVAYLLGQDMLKPHMIFRQLHLMCLMITPTYK